MIARTERKAGRRRWILTAAGPAVLALSLGACRPARDESPPPARSATSAAVAAAQPAGAEAPASTTGPVSVSVGMSHGCAVSADGRAWCWGANDGGQLGAAPDSESASTALPVDAPARFTAVAAGGAHSCALAKDGAVWCWGSNAEGQLGDGTTKSRARPAMVSGAERFTAVAVGLSHSCALSASGAAWCWGANQVGQLGRGDTSPSRTPARVSGDARFRALVAGGAATCGITTDGAVRCWGASPVGHADGSGALRASAPVEVPALRGATSLSLAPSLACAVTASRGVLCAGDNSAGQLGIGTADEALSEHPDPVAVLFPDGVTVASVAAGEGHACALAVDGHVWCWGRGASGEIGDPATLSACRSGTGTIPCAKRPVSVAPGRTFHMIATGSEETCGITRDGGLVCWGGGADRPGVREVVLGGR